MKELTVLVLMFCLAGCGGDDAALDDTPVGELIFTINGEDFARDGFVSEDGWEITFEHVYVNISGVTAFQVVETELSPLYLYHAGHPHAEIPEGSAHEALTGEFFVDVHQGDGPTSLGSVLDAPIGNYNRLNFNLDPATATSRDLVADHLDQTIVLIGTARKEDQTLTFTIRFNEPLHFIACGPHPEAIGVLAEGATARAEATLHFDHIFGDIDEGPADTTDSDKVNAVAIGFGPFASSAIGDEIDLFQADMEDMPEYEDLMSALATLGHTGEAHCHLDSSL